MSLSAIRRIHGTPVFLNFRSEIVQPICFTAVHWNGPGDTIYASEDRMLSSASASAPSAVHVQQLSADEAAVWIAAGGKAILYEMSVAGAAASED